MGSLENILISLDAKFADGILNGSKHVELRRRRMHVAPGTTLWIYAKVPVASVVGKACVEDIHAGSPEALWRKFGSVSGMSKPDFFLYFDGVSRGFALVLSHAERLRKAIPLAELRGHNKYFQPPQFFARMQPDHPVLSSGQMSFTVL